MTKDLTNLVDRIIETDVLIVGSEGAGSTAAMEAVKQGLRVTIVTKGSDVGRSGATVTGDADMDVDSRSLHDRFGLPQTDPRDSKEIFFKDVVKGGKYLNNQELVEIHVEEAPERFQDLIDLGIKFDQVFHCSGHTFPRGIFIPGTRLMRALRRAVYATAIEVIPHTMIIDLLTNGNQLAGAVGIDAAAGDIVLFRAKAVILATGGAIRMYPYTTAPEELTGDGAAIAYRAGAELIDMEFPMFLPGSFPHPPAVKGVDVPFILSTAGSIHGWLLNRNGDRFMRHWDPVNFERTTRDIASVAMMSEILAGRGSPNGGVYVSLKHLPDNLIDYIQEWKPSETLMQYGGFNMKDYLPDLKKEAVESVPASHFFNGGVKINTMCETNIAGLYAAGEVTGGVHGANRLSGNAFTEMLVWGHRAGRFAAHYAKELGENVSVDTSQVDRLRKRIITPLETTNGRSPVYFRNCLQQIAWEKAGVIRTATSLEAALAEFVSLGEESQSNMHIANTNRIFNREWIQALELESMLTVMEMVCRTSLKRQESRGSLYRSDFPQTNNIDFLINHIVRLKDGEMDITGSPVVITKEEPVRKMLKYGEFE
jgi:succinate dehydrogenase/fumarate reductase flavoprotein subunit